MTKSKRNLIVDILSYIGFVLLLGTGLILKYILPHGSGRILGGGTGKLAGEKTISTLWGLTGEQWGNIHFWIAIALLVILSLHLILHWRWIVSIFRKREKTSDSNTGRIFLGLAGMFGILAIALLPLFAPTEQVTRSQLARQVVINQSIKQVKSPKADSNNTNDTKQHTNNHDTSIQGRMSLLEIQEKTGVPYKHILKELDLPENMNPNEKLGRLKKHYGYSIDDIRGIISKYKVQ
ncbi:MAG: DUF4405 domain-containing protein [Candidatus Hatepunaea meridiana]|nr:DUF4405 domain-containing protein [Candidatus Hatepunaea meridiana]